MNGDTFTSSKKNNIPKNLLEDDNNFFLKRDALSVYGEHESTRRLNDYDSNLLKEDAYKDVNDDVFKLEYKISKMEKEIKDIDGQIVAAKEIFDFVTAEKLFERRKQVLVDLRTLYEMYNNASLSAKISGSLTSKIKSKFEKTNNILTNYWRILFRILPKKLVRFFEIKSSLNKLENINKSVDELMTLKIPYGESADKYDQLSKYIAKANLIQSNISRYIKL